MEFSNSGNTMKTRRWEEMEEDCLSNIFQKLGLDDLTLVVPFVCKSWGKVARDPLCWRVLNFRDLDFMPGSKFTNQFAENYSLEKSFSFSGFMKLAASRSEGSATEIQFPQLYGSKFEDIVYASNKLPNLKTVVLPGLMADGEKHIFEHVAKWTDLECLEMPSKPSSFLQMVQTISLNCKNFVRLRMSGSIKKEDAYAIVKLLPNIRYLDLSGSYICREQLLALVAGCKKLERLRVKDCFGFEADEDLLKKASGIKHFEYESCKFVDCNVQKTEKSDQIYVEVLPK